MRGINEIMAERKIFCVCVCECSSVLAVISCKSPIITQQKEGKGHSFTTEKYFWINSGMSNPRTCQTIQSISRPLWDLNSKRVFKELLISQTVGLCELDNRRLCSVNECAHVHPTFSEVIKLPHYDWFPDRRERVKAPQTEGLGDLIYTLPVSRLASLRSTKQNNKINL